MRRPRRSAFAALASIAVLVAATHAAARPASRDAAAAPAPAGQPDAAAPAVVERVEWEASEGGGRVVIVVRGTAHYSTHAAAADAAAGLPPRAYVDLRPAKLGAKLARQPIPIGDGLLQRIRIGQYDRQTARVVVDLAEPGVFDVRTVDRPSRLVLTVRPRSQPAVAATGALPTTAGGARDGAAPAPDARASATAGSVPTAGERAAAAGAVAPGGPPTSAAPANAGAPTAAGDPVADAAAVAPPAEAPPRAGERSVASAAVRDAAVAIVAATAPPPVPMPEAIATPTASVAPAPARAGDEDDAAPAAAAAGSADASHAAAPPHAVEVAAAAAAPAAEGDAPAHTDAVDAGAPVVAAGAQLAAAVVPAAPARSRGARSALAGRSRVVVLDPGHGGKDPGARGVTGDEEKHVTLAIAELVAEVLRPDPDLRVVLTRSGDETVTLEQRTAIANAQGADLFVSIHANASENTALAGVETYTLNNTNDRATIRLAAMENGLTLAGAVPGERDLAYILSDLLQTGKEDESVALAESLHQETVRTLRSRWKGVGSLGVKKGPFYVLVGAYMPCALVEVGFLSHEVEGQRVASRRYQRDVAEGIARGIRRFLHSAPANANL